MKNPDVLEKGELIEIRGDAWMVVDANYSAAEVERLSDGTRQRVSPTSGTGNVDSLELSETELDRSIEIMSDDNVAGMPVSKRTKGKATKTATKTKSKASAAASKTTKPAKNNESNGGVCPMTGAETKGNSVFAGLGTDSRAKSIMNKVLKGEMSKKEMTELVHDANAFNRAIASAKKDGTEKVTKPSEYFA